MKYKDTNNTDWLNKLRERVDENPSQLSSDSWSKMEQKLSEHGVLGDGSKVIVEGISKKSVQDISKESKNLKEIKHPILLNKHNKTNATIKGDHKYIAIAAICILILGIYLLLKMPNFSDKTLLNNEIENYSNILSPKLKQINTIPQDFSNYINLIISSKKPLNISAIKYSKDNASENISSSNELIINTISSKDLILFCSPLNLKLNDSNEFLDIRIKRLSFNEGNPQGETNKSLYNGNIKFSKETNKSLSNEELKSSKGKNKSLSNKNTIDSKEKNKSFSVKIDDDYIVYLNSKKSKNSQNRRSNWAMSVSGSPIISNSSNMSNVSYDIASDPSFLYSKEFKIVNNKVLRLNSVTKNTYKHKKPLNFGISISKGLTPKYFISSGIFYSFLSSEVRFSNESILTQKLNYITIPLILNYKFIMRSNYTLYVGAGGGIGKCIYGKLGDEKLTNNKLQFSLSAHLGFQLNIFHNFGIYIEPKVAYYFDDHSDITSYWKENKLSFNFQLGFRFRY